jgi:hypothetical protein
VRITVNVMLTLQIPKPMKAFIRNLVLYFLTAVAVLVAQQDSTVQCRTSLQDLEHRLAGDFRHEAERLRDEYDIVNQVRRGHVCGLFPGDCEHD